MGEMVAMLDLGSNAVRFVLARVEEALTFGGYLTLVVSTRGVRDGRLLRETFGRAR